MVRTVGLSHMQWGVVEFRGEQWYVNLLSHTLCYQYSYCYFALSFPISLLFLGYCSYLNTGALPFSAFISPFHPATAGNAGKMSKQGVVWSASVPTLNWEAPLLNRDRGVSPFVIIMYYAFKISAVVKHYWLTVDTDTNIEILLFPLNKGYQSFYHHHRHQIDR